ncbi:hypothetical protein GMB80_13665 [Turicibacter sanguinis]|nr:hypothetical protein [Turicibacter sanguinis]
MEKDVLITCVSKKRDYACKARDLYISEWFKKSLAYAEKVIKSDKIFILSAEYGVVSIEKVIAPYDKTLTKMNKIERVAWSNLVVEELNQHIDLENDEVMFLAGKRYREHLEPHIKNMTVSMEGLKIGQQLRFLKEKIYE